MSPIQVLLVNKEFDWPAWVGAVGSILAIGASWRLGAWLQDREHRQKESGELAAQRAALEAIADRCVTTLKHLDDRATKGTFKSDEWGWLNDEANAMEATVGSVDLMTIKSTLLIEAVADLQEAARTGRRRLGFVENTVKNARQPKPDHFNAPLSKAQKALLAIQALR